MTSKSKISMAIEKDLEEVEASGDEIDEAIKSTKKKSKSEEKPQFDFNKYKIANRTVQKTLEVEGAEFSVTVKPLSWAKRNQLVSRCLQLGADGANSFNGDLYIRECLKEMIVDAPWGRTTESFLVSIDNRLGSALEQLVPNAFGSNETGALGPDEIKKG